MKTPFRMRRVILGDSQGTDNQDRANSRCQDSVGDAAVAEPAKTAPTVSRHRDQVNAVAARSVDYRLGSIGINDDLGFDGKAALPQLPRQRLKVIAALSLGAGQGLSMGFSSHRLLGRDIGFSPNTPGRAAESSWLGESSCAATRARVEGIPRRRDLGWTME